MKKSIAFLLLLAVTMFTAVAQTNYYIDASHPNANDANAGTDPAAPWLTLKTGSWNNINDGDIINIAAGVYIWTTVAITKSIVIQGASRASVILQGMSDADFDSKTGTNSRLASIGVAGSSTPNVTFKRMTLRNSIHPTSNHGFFFLSKASTLNLEDMLIERSYGASRYGGAIQVRGTLNCTDVVFSNNIALQGGAIFAETEDNTMNFLRCEFTDNSTKEGGAAASKVGGAIYINNNAGKINTAVFDECLFDSNIEDGTGNGGALAMRLNVAGGVINVTVKNCAFLNNKTYNVGSAIYTGATGTASATSKFTLDVRNTTFIGNVNHAAGSKNGSCLNVFTNTGYNSTSQRGVFNLINNTFYNNTNGETTNRSIYIADPKMDMTIVNNVFLDTDPTKTAYSIIIQGPSDNPVYSTLVGRGNIGDKMGGSLFTTTYEGYNWGGAGYGNVRNKYNDEILLNTTPEYTTSGIPFLPIAASNSILVNAGFSTYGTPNLVPQSDIRGQAISGSSKDAGAYEFNLISTKTDIMTKSGIICYPNPFSEIIRFKEVVATVMLFDITGKMCIYATNQEQLDTSVLESGIYFLTGETTEGRKIVEKVVKK